MTPLNNRQSIHSNLDKIFHHYPDLYHHVRTRRVRAVILSASPETIAIISGASEWRYRNGEPIEMGIDTFISGSVGEAVPAMSYESRTNFLNIGHYWSEKAGPLALQAAIEQQFKVETTFIDVANMI